MKKYIITFSFGLVLFILFPFIFPPVCYLFLIDDWLEASWLDENSKLAHPQVTNYFIILNVFSAFSCKCHSDLEMSQQIGHIFLCTDICCLKNLMKRVNVVQLWHDSWTLFGLKPLKMYPRGHVCHTTSVAPSDL